MSGINVLIYTGNGTSPNSVRHTQNTLKSLLGHAYDVVPVDAKTLRQEPWEGTCALLVVPGGRDLPYCNDLNGVATSRIKQYVRCGGRYLGLCAGGYFGSSTIEFEQDRKDMQVCGKRELEFFPGLCRGTVYPGFVYESEQGARSTAIRLVNEHLQPYYPSDSLVPKSIDMYYNGGGYFAHADQYPNVQVLGRFVDAGICKDEDYPAAAVHCTIGDGSAVLISTHPEYDMSLLEQPDMSSEMLAELQRSEPDRKAFLRAVFAKMGLKVVGFAKGQVDEIKVPDLTPVYLTALKGQIAHTIATELQAEAKDSVITDSNDTFLLSSSSDDPVLKKLAALTVDDEDRPKPIEIRIPDFSSDPACPERSLTPHFDIKAYYDALLARRDQEWGGGRWYLFGNALMYTEVINSTQTILDKNYNFAQKLPTGLVCTATTQLAARARARNSWVSQLGALQFSYILRHSLKLSHAPVVFLQYIIALAVVESVRSRKGYEGVPLRVKWPNDVYAEDGDQLKKVGGILVNSSFVQDEFLIVIGCGINVSNPRPTVSINDVIQAHNPSLPRISPEDMLAGILVLFERFYSEFCEKGMGSWFLDLYYKRWLHSDKVVTLTTHDNVRVRITGITSDWGMLEAVAVEGGKRFTLQPDGNSFDMLKGLIMKKM
ncbi:biotin-protein ligase [Zychaea mexicana]|uniref:biotin-protein ligase n=1 Tax=Zychaea mexicana TaxID=64656 RepID=UPI0022FDC89B|nr:biotin-protein ligase [Zychaea mexicana]KAI9488995.1 biotin-protein ligase [Zychaea mexicana]